MLVAENLRLARWLPRRPLNYRILFEGLLFSLLFIYFHVVEKVVTGSFKERAAAESVPAIGGGGLAGIASVALIMFVMLIPFFCSKSELPHHQHARKLEPLIAFYNTGWHGSWRK